MHEKERERERQAVRERFLLFKATSILIGTGAGIPTCMKKQH
jgi:hypothetical protein